MNTAAKKADEASKVKVDDAVARDEMYGVRCDLAKALRDEDTAFGGLKLYSAQKVVDRRKHPISGDDRLVGRTFEFRGCVWCIEEVAIQNKDGDIGVWAYNTAETACADYVLADNCVFFDNDQLKGFRNEWNNAERLKKRSSEAPTPTPQSTTNVTTMIPEGWKPGERIDVKVAATGQELQVSVPHGATVGSMIRVPVPPLALPSELANRAARFAPVTQEEIARMHNSGDDEQPKEDTNAAGSSQQSSSTEEEAADGASQSSDANAGPSDGEL